MPTIMTNMTIFMSPKYSCPRNCNVDDAKVIVNLNQINTALRREIKTNRVVQRRWNHKNKRKKQKICEITYSIMIEGKTIRRGDFWVKIDPKSPLWKEEEVKKKGWRLGFEKERRERGRMLCSQYSLEHIIFLNYQVDKQYMIILFLKNIFYYK